jgi:hypothetical protein
MENEFMKDNAQAWSPDEFGVVPAAPETIDEGGLVEKAVGNKSMIFYEEWFRAFQDLPRDVRMETIEAVIEYGLYGSATGQLKPVTKAMLGMVKGRIDLNRTRFANGKKGGRPAKDRVEPCNVYQHKETYINNKNPKNQSETKAKPKRNQTETKVKPTENQTETNPEPNSNQTEPKPNHIYNNIILSPKVDNISSNSNELEALRPARVREGEPLPLSRIKDMWNGTCVSYPRLIKLSDARKNKIRIRLDEMGGGEKGLEVMQEIFRRLEGSDFLKGDNDRGWRAGFDWIFENSKNWVKVWEGNYDGRSHKGSPKSVATDSVNDIWNDGEV